MRVCVCVCVFVSVGLVTKEILYLPIQIMANIFYNRIPLHIHYIQQLWDGQNQNGSLFVCLFVSTAQTHPVFFFFRSAAMFTSLELSPQLCQSLPELHILSFRLQYITVNYLPASTLGWLCGTDG